MSFWKPMTISSFSCERAMLGHAPLAAAAASVASRRNLRRDTWKVLISRLLEVRAHLTRCRGVRAVRLGRPRSIRPRWSDHHSAGVAIACLDYDVTQQGGVHTC